MARDIKAAIRFSSPWLWSKAKLSKYRGQIGGGPSKLIDLRVVTLVTEHWHNAAMKAGWKTTAQVTSYILKAIDGETDPRELGVDPSSTEFEELERIHARNKALGR